MREWAIIYSSMHDTLSDKTPNNLIKNREKEGAFADIDSNKKLEHESMPLSLMDGISWQGPWPAGAGPTSLMRAFTFFETAFNDVQIKPTGDGGKMATDVTMAWYGLVSFWS